MYVYIYIYICVCMSDMKSLIDDIQWKHVQQAIAWNTTTMNGYTAAPEAIELATFF